MNLMQKIEADLIVAMKARDRVSLTTLRALKSDIKNLQISAGTRDQEPSDEQVIGVLSSAAKRHRDSIEQFRAGDRQDLVDIETRELELIQKYLPEQMSAEEIRTKVNETVERLGISGAAQVGALMKELMPELKGKADGKLINQIAREVLAQGNSNS